MGSLVLTGDTSGSVTVAVPAVAGTNTATFPAATGTVMVSGNMPAFSAYQSSAQTTTAATYTKVQFQTEEFDTNNNFDSTTNYRFTPTVAGYYQLTGGINGSGQTTAFQVVLYKNGSAFKFFANTTAVDAGIYGTALVYANGSTDYFELYAYSGTASTLTAANTLTYFQGAMVRTS